MSSALLFAFLDVAERTSADLTRAREREEK